MTGVQSMPNKGSSDIHFKGMTYTAALPDGSLRSENQIYEDMKKFTKLSDQIRLYSTDGEMAKHVFSALNKLGVKTTVYMGLWIRRGAEDMQKDLDNLLAILTADPKNAKRVKYLSVGNEEIYNKMDMGQLIGYIEKVRGVLKSKGLKDILVGTTEIESNWYKQLADKCDFFGVNIQTQFGAPMETSVDYARSAIERYGRFQGWIKDYRNNKPIVVAEVGHSTSQKAELTGFVQEWLCAANRDNIDYYYFSFRDEPWKAPGDPANIENHFGYLDGNNSPKVNSKTLTCSAPNK
ncbi:hypothetical protein IWQ62_001744 [Dispira parvispora]|uniref:glucan endo-1,3-beta-D-glucosidase n=1 Tax=Dispira parvispora TaxID=1520584 RepID=A0A9W8ARQ2_9FUNG|nr:hypothetical protein IWQ62_001744 [Dispira parvispora]